MSGFVGLHTALTGIRAAQVGLDTASHNVANAHTPGYTRQRVDLASRPPWQSPVGPVGTGVDVTGIGRLRDAFLDQRARLTAASAAGSGLRADLLDRAERLLGEPDHGVTAELTKLWDSFEDLANTPADSAARRGVVTSLQSVSARIRAVATAWDELAADTATRGETSVAEANDALNRIAALNDAVASATARGESPGDLQDERDLLADRLATLLGVTVRTDADGALAVHLDGEQLVDGTVASTLALGGAPTYELTTDAGVTVTPGGEVGAVQQVLTVDLPALSGELDALAVDLADAVNTVHAGGWTTDPATGTDIPGGELLRYTAGPGAAATLAAATEVVDDPRLLAPAAATPVAAHDGRTAAALAALRDTAVGGSTIDERARQLTVGLAADVAAAGRTATADDGVRLAAAQARQSAHGVSLDEEMVSLVQHQRALEAASRVMTAVDQALDVLVNRTGLVGR